ncbi:MAG: TonB-dependent receptor, partial [Verrucomicrobiota bacterium]
MKSNKRTASRLNSQIGMLMLPFSVLLPTIGIHAEAANESIGRVGNTVELAEITVTARSLKEPQREVPFSISVFDSGTLEGSRIFQTEDLFRSAPNFNFTDSGIPEANLLNIRGVGSSSTFLSPSVVYYIDGVPVQARAFDTQFLDVAQIEILRGPQGTLFGQSAQAGAVHITTKAPVSESEVAINGSYGSYDAARLTTAVTGALSEDLTGRISVVYFERDGDIDNATFTAPGVFTSEEVIRERESLGVSGKLQYTPTSSTRLTLSGSIQTDDQNPTTGLLVNDDVFPINALNPIPENELDVYRASLRLEHDIGDIEFTSITGYEHYDLGLLADISDGFIASANTGFSASAFAFPNNIRNIDEDSTQLSQEFCFHGEYGNTSTWVGGLSGLHSDFESSTAVTSIALPSGTYTGEVERNNVAVFGETTYALTDDLRIIAGARVTWEESRLDGKWIGSGPPSVASFNESGAFDSVFATGRLGVSFDLNERLTTFATIARGEKPGGFPFFNQGAAFANPIDAFGEATTWSYEAGLKGSFADGKFSFAASIFYNDNSDEQFFIFNPLVGQFQVENANS